MKIIFTAHAKIRLMERNIPVSFIKQVLKNPDYENITFGDKIKIRKELDGKTLEIICAKFLNKIIIITFYYL